MCILFVLSQVSDEKVFETLAAFANNKKSGYERESAPIGFHALATVLGPPAGPLFLPHLAALYELFMDKGDVVRQATTAANKAILALFPPEATRLVFRTLEGILENGKWRTKVAALDALRGFVKNAPQDVANELAVTLPKVEVAMHDTKSEVSDAISCSRDAHTHGSRLQAPQTKPPRRCAPLSKTQI